MWSHHVTGLWAVFGSFCPQGKLHLRRKLTVSLWRVVRIAVVFIRWQLHCLTATTLFGRALPQLGGAIQFWVLSSVSRDQLQDPPPTRYGKLACHPTPHSQSLCLSWPPLSTRLLWGIGCHPISVLSLCCFSWIHSLRVQHWAFGFLTHPCSLWQVQCSVPTSAASVRLQFTAYAFQFYWGGDSICPGAALDYVSRVGGGVLLIMRDAHLFVRQIHSSSFGASQQGEMALLLSVQHSVGRLSMG
jgi:hypothetical protein